MNRFALIRHISGLAQGFKLAARLDSALTGQRPDMELAGEPFLGLMEQQ